ncbi:MAG: hypothetical protein WCO55_06040 [Candidatus Falkowbacteria bacterium]
MDYLKIGKATDLTGKEYKLYRFLEMLPGILSWGTLIILVIFSYFQPVWVAVFIILFNIYWLLLVAYLAIHLVASFRALRKNEKVDWQTRCSELESREFKIKNIDGSVTTKAMAWTDLWQVVIMPTLNEDYAVFKTTLNALMADQYPKDRMIIVLAIEERGGAEVKATAERIKEEFGNKFGRMIIAMHPDGIVGELKGKGANQSWAAKELKARIIDPEGLDYDAILVSVFDIDTVVYPGYFHNLTWRFFHAEHPHRSSYQPIPVYNNNIWQAPFFARIAAFSNTFWQMMLQIREEKLATYSSHSMTWRTLSEIGFWSPKMVSEDSRIFFHSFFFYNGDYRVEPLHFPVSMDAVMDKNILRSASNLYKQQRRWGWGVENVPYLIFNTIKHWKTIPKKKAIYQISVQIHGFHSWATNALIIALIGRMPLWLGGSHFTSSVLSTNLPIISQNLMNLAMVGMLLSAVVSMLLLPPKPKNFPFWKHIQVFLEWAFLPVAIVIFGAVPGLEAQTRLMFGKYMGFWVTPKKR